MDNTSVNTASGQGAEAGSAFEPVSDFAFAPEPVSQGTANQAAQPAGQKGAGAVDAQRSAEARGNEPRNDSAQNRFQRQQPQKDIGKAFDKESERVRTQAQREYEQKLAADPHRKVAMLMIADVMRNEGITEEQAIQKIENGFYASIAEREGVSIGMARMLYAQQQAATQQTVSGANPAQDVKPNQNTQQQQPAQPSVNEEASAIVDELLSMDMPDGFDLDAAIADMEFTKLLRQYPTEAAVENYQLRQQAASASQAAANAPQQLADKLRSRAEIPQSSRSSSAAAPPNFKTMTTEEFRMYQREHNLT